MRIDTAVDEFILAGGADGLKETTLTWYESILKKYRETAGNHELGIVTPSDIRRYLVYLRSLNYSEDTIHGHTRALHRFWRWCANEYQIPNPMANIRYPKQPRPKMPKAVQVEDVIKLLDACEDSPRGKRDKAIIAFLMDTGCRVGGLCGLRLPDLDLEHHRAYVIEKGSKRRVVHFSDATALLLSDWLTVRNPDADYLFHGKAARRLKPNGVLQMLTRRKEQVGITGRVNPHAFRHGFAREYLRSGGDVSTLSRILGHEDSSVTTMFYGVFAEDELAAAHRLHTPMKQIEKKVEEKK